MRISAFLVVAGLVVGAGSSWADPRADLQAKGEQLAKDGRYGEAIDAFKAADKIQPRASHACLIALAYTRRELWPQAQLFLAMCHERAKAGDPLPDWVPLADKQIRERLASANVVEVAIEVKPAAANAKVTVSSFAPDEIFDPRTIHLPPGTHVIFAKADGYKDVQQTLVIQDKTPQRLVLDMGPPLRPMVAETTTTTTSATTTSPGHTDAGPKRPSRLGRNLMIVGAVVGVVGIGLHIRMAGKRSDLEQAMTDEEFDTLRGPFQDARRDTAVAYIVAGGLVVTGYILNRRAKREAAMVGVAPLPEGGAFVALRWAR